MDTPTQLLSVRFVGASLETQGVPIYDLAQSLISIQRIIHKSYLATEGRLSDSPMATKSEREKLALRLGERRRKSDEYGLVAFLGDPGIQATMAGVVSALISGLLLYAQQRSLATRESDKAPPVIFNVSIYNQVLDIANRINGIGGVEKVEIFGARDGVLEVVTIDQETQTYIRGLKSTFVRGEERELEGKVKELNTNHFTVTLTDDTRSVDVSLTANEFEKIRYARVTFPWIKVKGCPIYRLGVEGDVFERFEGHTVTSVEETYNEDDILPSDG